MSGARPIRRSSPFHRHPAEFCRCPSKSIDAESGLIAFEDEEGRVEQSALGGMSKLQWKVDWAARWVALGVDYEMAGKDLIDSVVQSSKIARVLGGRPPEGFNYEMFLDEKGEKISKSKGNGLSLEEWLRYGSEPSLAFYIYREPRKAKSLHLGLIPRAVDEYWQFRGNYAAQPTEQRLGNPVHHIHNGKIPAPQSLPLTYGLLLNLVSLPGIHDKETAWRFVQRYAPDTSADTHAELDELIGLAVNYARDFVVPTLKRRPPTDMEAEALRDLDSELAKLTGDTDAETIQTPRVRGRQEAPVREPAQLVPGPLRNPARILTRAAHGQLHRALWRGQ